MGAYECVMNSRPYKEVSKQFAKNLRASIQTGKLKSDAKSQSKFEMKKFTQQIVVYC